MGIVKKPSFMSRQRFNRHYGSAAVAQNHRFGEKRICFPDNRLLRLTIPALRA
jgi:hypothetical protein